MQLRYLLILAILLAMPSKVSAFEKVDDTCDVAETQCVAAAASASQSCSGGNCWYAMGGGASACAVLGGSVTWGSSVVNGEFTVPLNSCNSGSDGRTGAFGSNCHTVIATMISPSGPLTDQKKACA